LKLFLLAALSLVLISCAPGPSPDYLVGELWVEGTVTHADISYQAWGGSGVNELFNVALPWAKTTDFVLSGERFYLSARGNDAVGDLTVMALADGDLLAAETVSEPFGSVAIYGAAP
jgi:hypothetical protein